MSTRLPVILKNRLVYCLCSQEMSLLSYNEPEYVANTLAEYLGDNKGAEVVDACAGTGRVGKRVSQSNL